MIFKKNSCDGIYRSIDVHFTNFCDNKCIFCIDSNSKIINNGKPNWKKIFDSIYKYREKIDDILILGGEPFLFLEELYLLVNEIKEKTNLKVFITTSLPKTCYDNQELFYKILEKLDGLNISAQHYDESISDKMRGTKSSYDRQKFYKELKFKEKIRINLNIVLNYLDTESEILKCLKYFNNMGFSSIKLTEMQHSTIHFKSFEDIFNIKFGSPFFYGCQTNINKMLESKIKISCDVILKRSCFNCEVSLKASLLDGIKAFLKIFTSFFDRKSFFTIIYEDGGISKTWLKKE